MADTEYRDRYCDKTLQELKEILLQRKLKLTGKKKDLVERLRFDDINSTKLDPVPEFHMTLPEAQTYIDLHRDHLQNFPTFTKRRLLDFFLSCDKSYDEKVEMLYAQRYIRFVRFTKDQDDLTFVTAVIWAEMKKKNEKTCYKVDLCIDKNGAVKESQCECAVGQGPSAHCKHIGCILFPLTRYCTSGSILTEVTCTQILQKFHKPKPHRGSPLKARNLSTARGKANNIVYDPRPVRRRDPAKIEETLRNTVLNWQGNSKWPVIQKYPSANIQALAADHDYLGLTWEEHFLRREQVSEISPEQVLEIERQTRGQHLSSRWAQERVKRMTASNFGVICKATERRDIDQLLRTLTGSSVVYSKTMAHGKKYEGIAVELFEKKTGLHTMECGLFVSRTHPVLAASPDRILDSDILVEVKCPYSACNQLISERTVPYLTTVNDTLTLKRNHNYYFQVQGQLFCSKRTMCKFIVYTFKDMKILDIPLYDTFAKDMLTKLMQFYDSHFKSAIIQKFMYRS